MQPVALVAPLVVQQGSPATSSALFVGESEVRRCWLLTVRAACGRLQWHLEEMLGVHDDMIDSMPVMADQLFLQRSLSVERRECSSSRNSCLADHVDQTRCLFAGKEK